MIGQTHKAWWLGLMIGNAFLLATLGKTDTSVGITLVVSLLLGFNGLWLGLRRLAASPVWVEGSFELRGALALVLTLIVAGGLWLGHGDPGAPNTQIPDILTGWTTAPNAHCLIDSALFGRAAYSTGPHGFRRWGDPATKRRKLLVIGNSPTQAVQVSDGEAYFDFLGGKQSGFEVFAFGCGGFGTLQEYLVLDRVAEIIRPDLVLWQFTGNDLVYNLHAIERDSFFKNQHVVRPYWEDGKMAYRYTRRYPFHLEIAAQVSGLFRLGLVEYDRLLFTHDRNRTIENSLFPDHPLVRDALRTTGDLLRKARERLPGSVYYAFCTDSDEVFPELTAKAGMIFVPGVAATIARAARAGERVDGRPFDNHWNARGHRLVGDYLRARLPTPTHY